MKWVAVAGLGALGFAFPPVWIALGLYLVWTLVLKGGMRSSVIRKDLSDLLSGGRQSGYIGVRYSDAEKYALQFGGQKNISGSEMLLEINGETRKVDFSQPHDKDKKYMTYVSVKDK